MSVFEISEVFTSLEGEVLIGIPTTYIRFARCNFKCPLFNNPNREVTDKGYAKLTFNPKDYDSLASLPPVASGCDTQYAVNPEFSHIWYKKTADELVDEVISKFPKKTPAVSLTGGEPTLKWKQMHEILQHPKMQDVKMYIVETNCAVPFKEQFLTDISEWLAGHPERE
jgi:organic radical activating enzyme